MNFLVVNVRYLLKTEMAQVDKERRKIIRDLTILRVILEQISGIFPTYQI